MSFLQDVKTPKVFLILYRNRLFRENAFFREMVHKNSQLGLFKFF